ncbi:hypothetical protein GCM10029964_036300 [Kibdelosporangium lantanae]
MPYAMLSITNHLGLRTTGFDLGIFEQAVRGYAHLRAPVSELKGPGYVLLGDHFHPILALLAPLYRLFPSPITLLVAQAVLIGVSAVPVARLALGRFGVVTGVAITVAYGLSWGLQTAADFDFHEVVFAVPLMAFAIECLLGERWRAAVCWAAPLVLVKEDLPITLAAIGVYLVLKGQRRLGLWVFGLSLAAFVLTITVVIPSMNPVGSMPSPATSVRIGRSGRRSRPCSRRRRRCCSWRPCWHRRRSWPCSHRSRPWRSLPCSGAWPRSTPRTGPPASTTTPS